MTDSTTLTFAGPPSALIYMLKAMGHKRADPTGFPDLQLVWQGYRIESSLLDAFRAVLPALRARDDRLLTLAAPQVTGFRLVMATLTQSRWPLPIWGALQIRNRLRQFDDIDLDTPGTLTTGVNAWRTVDKGLEVDLCTQFVQAGRTRWEGVVTFYYRGRFASMRTQGEARGAPRDAPEPTGTESIDVWRVGSESRRQFSRWTGDYNGIHRWDSYARLFGFKQAFAHPQSPMLQCLARLPNMHSINALDLWIKGPVPYGSRVELRHQNSSLSGEQSFWLHVDGDARAALIGRACSPKRTSLP